MTPTEELRKRLDELGIKWKSRDRVHPITVWHDEQFSYEYTERTLLNGVTPYSGEVVDGTGRLEAVIDVCSPEQAIAATVGGTVWEPSKEWKAWHESLKHDNPTTIREAVENILFDAIDFGGDMGPNGNVWSGVDEGDVFTEKCIDGWVKSIESVAATVGERTCHCTTPDDAWCFSCSSCGKSFPRSDLHMAHNHGEINYCPNCGRKVVE